MTHLGRAGRLTAFVAALLLMLAGGYTIGAAVGPLDATPAHESNGEHP